MWLKYDDEYSMLFHKEKHNFLGSLQPTNLKAMPFDSPTILQGRQGRKGN